MRTLIGALLAVSALTPTLAGAQEVGLGAKARIGRGDDRAPPSGGWQDRGPPSGVWQDRGAEGPRGDRPDGSQDHARPDPRPDNRADPGADRRPDDRWSDRGVPRDNDRGPPRTDPRGNGRDGDWTRSRFDRRDDGWTRSRFDDRGQGGQWSRDWRSDGRYDWNGNRAAHRSAYRLPRYYAPGGGGGYRRFAVGAGLDASLWSRDYWIADSYSYRLPPAYGPYRWVRYYGDALLIDQRSGRVVDAVYGIFW